MAARNPPPRQPATRRQAPPAPPPPQQRTAPPPVQRAQPVTRQGSNGSGRAQAQPPQQRTAPPAQQRTAPPAQQRTAPPAQRPAQRPAPAIIPAREMTQLPAYMRRDVGRGLEHIDASDYEMPRLKLLQGLSPELTTFNDLKQGEFFHTLAEQSLGTSLEVVLLHISKRYVLWRPRWDGGGILARSNDAVHWTPPHGQFIVHTDKSKKQQVTWNLAPTVVESGLGEWGSADPDDPNSVPAATLCFQFIAALPEYPDLSPVALLLQRTALRPAKRLIGKLKIAGAPIYGLRYQMESVDDSSGENEFKNWQFSGSGFVDEAEYAQYKQMHESFSENMPEIRDLEDAQEDDLPADRGAVSEAEAVDAANQRGY